jgi:hypothetical protein
METIAWEANGLSRGRANNVRSLLAKALAYTHPMLPGRRAAALSPEWEALLTGLRPNRAAGLLALARNLSVEGIRPEDVALADLEAYRDAIHNDRLRAKPEQT